MSQFQVADECPIRNFSMMPNVVEYLGLTVYEYRVYGALRRIAGESSCCFMSNKNIAKLCNMSEAKYRDVKKRLATHKFPLLNGKTLIKVTIRQKKDKSEDTTLITLTNIWPENEAYAQHSKNSYPCHDMADPLPPHGTKEYTIKNIPSSLIEQQQLSPDISIVAASSNSVDIYPKSQDATSKNLSFHETISPEDQWMVEELESRLGPIGQPQAAVMPPPAGAAASFEKKYKVKTSANLTVSRPVEGEGALEEDAKIVLQQVEQFFTHEERLLAVDFLSSCYEEVFEADSPAAYVRKAVKDGWARSKIEGKEEKQRKQQQKAYMNDKDGRAREKLPLAEAVYKRLEKLKLHRIFDCTLTDKSIQVCFLSKNGHIMGNTLGFLDDNFEYNLQRLEESCTAYVSRIKKNFGLRLKEYHTWGYLKELFNL